jgi:hypothetical protein
MTYRAGQRIALVHTDDPVTALQPGDQGTVRSFDEQQGTVAVSWDSGSTLSMCLNAGDRIRVIAEPDEPDVNTPPIIDPPPVDAARGESNRVRDRLRALAEPAATGDQAWQHALSTVTDRGRHDGQRAVEHWAQELTERTPATIRTSARQILQAIDGDDLTDTTLPWFETSTFSQPPDDQQLSQLLAAGNPGVVQPVNPAQWAQAVEAYGDGFEAAVRERAGDWCRRVLIPAAGGRDLAALRPENVRLGRIGVFSGDWLVSGSDDGPDFFRIGFAGTLIDRWNGWAVFACARPVAEAIVADQQQQRVHELGRLQAGGMPEPDARAEVDGMLADLSFDGDRIVADQRVMSDDPEAIERIDPDPDGGYVVMGGNWCWEPVDPYACDRIVGELPAAGAEQEFVALTHTPGMRLPHDRVQLQIEGECPVADGRACVAGLLLDGRRIDFIGADTAGGLTLTDPAASSWPAFLTGCRYIGRPVSWQRLLDALIDEIHVAAAIEQATAAGQILVRVVDDVGHTRSLRSIPPVPAERGALDRLGADLPREQSGRWQLWTGQTWLVLPADTGQGA